MRIQSMSLAFATAMLAFGVPSATSAEQHGSVGGLDHVLIWSRNIDQITSVMAVKLGFQVRPGGDFGDGVANRLIPFADKSYLELLYFTLPEAELSAEVRKPYAATERGAMTNMFALEARDVDDVERQLKQKGWQLAPSSPMTYDPDGDGPQGCGLFPMRTFLTPRRGWCNVCFGVVTGWSAPRPLRTPWRGRDLDRKRTLSSVVFVDLFLRKP